VFEYEMDSPAALYGSVPFMMAHRKNESVGVFWMNPSETWIDIVKTPEQPEGVSVTSEITKLIQYSCWAMSYLMLLVDCRSKGAQICQKFFQQQEEHKDSLDLGSWHS
jgi:alpha-glucosidase (family GH31 glycosyl hydrolase)